MNNPNTPMPVSELIKNMAIDAAETLRPKNNKTVIELPDLQEMIGLLGNFRPEGNAVMQPQVSDMPSYDMMLADNSNANPNQEIDDRMMESGNQYIDPYADAPGPTNEDLSPEQMEFLRQQGEVNSMENYEQNLLNWQPQ